MKVTELHSKSSKMQTSTSAKLHNTGRTNNHNSAQASNIWANHNSGTSKTQSKKSGSDNKTILCALENAENEVNGEKKTTGIVQGIKNTASSVCQKIKNSVSSLTEHGAKYTSPTSALSSIKKSSGSSSTTAASDSGSTTEASTATGSAEAKGLIYTYTHNGETYKSLLSQEGMTNLVEQAKDAGIGTSWDAHGTCLQISKTYGCVIYGNSDYQLTSDDKGAIIESNSEDEGKFTKLCFPKEEDMLAEIKTQLDHGKPVILHVNGNPEGTSRHFVTAFGYKSSAGDKLNADDLLFWDSYDCSIRTLASSKDTYKADGTDRFFVTGEEAHKTDYHGYRIEVMTEDTSSSAEA